MAASTRSVAGRHVERVSHGWYLGLEPEGAFHFGMMRDGDGLHRCLWIHMPYDAPDGMHTVHCLRVYREGEPKPAKTAWLWDGNVAAPTLSPSIVCGPPGEEDWHGYLRAGRLESC